MPAPKTPLVTTDGVVFHDNGVVLIRRKNEPFKGQYALPGGFAEIGETIEDACRREMKEETGLDISNLQLIGVYSRPDRDPRGHTISVAFLGEADVSRLRAGSDAAEAEVVENWAEQDLAFDHREIVEDAWKMKTGEK